MANYYHIKIGNFDGYVQILVSDTKETTQFNMIYSNGRGAKTIELFDDEIAALGKGATDRLVKYLLQGIFNGECETFELLTGDEENTAHNIMTQGFNLSDAMYDMHSDEIKETQDTNIEEQCENEFGPYDDNELEPETEEDFAFLVGEQVYYEHRDSE